MKKRLISVLKYFQGRDPALIGALIGFTFAFLWVVLGFWETLFVLALTGLGYYLGARFFDDPEDLRQLLDRIFPPGRTR